MDREREQARIKDRIQELAMAMAEAWPIRIATRKAEDLSFSWGLLKNGGAVEYPSHLQDGDLRRETIQPESPTWAPL